MGIDPCLSKKTDEWETPQDLFDVLNQAYHFTLDPCATKENAKCKRFLTKEDNALSWSSWGKNEICFVNPPYSKLKEFLRVAVNNKSVCLIPARTDTKAFHEWVFKYATGIVFIKGRLKFGGSKNSAPFPSALAVFNLPLHSYLTGLGYVLNQHLIEELHQKVEAQGDLVQRSQRIIREHNESKRVR